MPDENSIIGRIQNALMSATNEVVVTAANINFDFSMVKYEAPPEYRGIGGSLTSTRRHEAEAGEIHVTARRLGALFDGICPPTPSLIAAYGTRATEIARKAASSASLDSSNWIFSAYAGIDATSLWAAATSKKAALSTHLLACLLARAWDEGEATSLWVELVAERRKEVAAKLEAGEELPFAHLSAAAQAEISREQLAKWDASARAWLRTADGVMGFQYKQLLLIIKNISLPVNEERITYQSVIAAWISALTTMEKVIEGGPHVVRDGAVLLALSSWHLYADMVVVGGPNGSTAVPMSDALISPAGVLTLGVSDTGVHAKKGVYWSLSLAHHRFYGRPVAKTVHVDGMATRMTFLEFQQAALGAILSHWKIPARETVETLRFLLELGRVMLQGCPPDDSINRSRWIKSLTVPIAEYFNNEVDGATAVSLGRRRSTFVPSRKDGNPGPPLFGLNSLPKLFQVIPDAQGRIELLRRLCSSVPGLRDREPVIAYLDGGYWQFMALFHPAPGVNQSKRPRRDLAPPSVPWTLDTHRPAELPFQVRPPRQENNCFPYWRFDLQSPQLIRVSDQKRFVYHFGDTAIAAVFVSEPTGSLSSTASLACPTVGYSDLRWLMDHDLIEPEALRNTVYDLKCPVVVLLVQLAVIAGVYSGLSKDGAMVSSRVLSSPFKPAVLPFGTTKPQAGFIADGPHTSTHTYWWHHVNAVEIASLIAYLETGQDLLGLEYQPNCERLLGLCIGDSIYVPQSILMDPHDQSSSRRFTRLLGNIGRPGLTLLTCPQHPDCQDDGSLNWRQCAAPYDGVQEDMFRHTTLHLSLTEWANPLWQNTAVGERNSSGTHVEAVVSVRDSGRWIADIDPIRALRNAHVVKLPSQKSCTHSAELRRQPLPHMREIESWDQVLDCEEGLVVAKAHKNWVGRLGLVCVLSHHCRLRQKRIVICPETVCWECVKPTSNLDENTIFVY